MTIREVARLAGVSIATVSRTINNPSKVSSGTRYKVAEIISRYKFRPNENARGLARQRSKTESRTG
jgi:LacI family transcriptional regulator